MLLAGANLESIPLTPEWSVLPFSHSFSFSFSLPSDPHSDTSLDDEGYHVPSGNQAEPAPIVDLRSLAGAFCWSGYEEHRRVYRFGPLPNTKFYCKPARLPLRTH